VFGVVVIEFQKMLCRIDNTSSIVVIASWICSFKNLFRHSGKENPAFKPCLRADAIYIRCVVYDVKHPEMIGILVVIYGRDISYYGYLCCQGQNSGTLW